MQTWSAGLSAPLGRRTAPPPTAPGVIYEAGSSARPLRLPAESGSTKLGLCFRLGQRIDGQVHLLEPTGAEPITDGFFLNPNWPPPQEL